MNRSYETGIRYCAPDEEIGFRGISGKIAVLIPIPGKGESGKEEIFLPRGVGVLKSSLPYLPDMGEESEYKKNGYWHYFKVNKSIFIIFLNEQGLYYEVLSVAQFKDENTPRILKDERVNLLNEGILNPGDIIQIEDLLYKKEIVLS